MQYFGFDRPSFAFKTYGFEGNNNVEWLPSELFSLGAKGVWYDPSDITTLYQDASGTIPVSASGDPVGLMMDKSGNNYHIRQPLSSSRPTYQTDGVLHWLSFDGIDDIMEVDYLTQSIPQPYSICVGATAMRLPNVSQVGRFMIASRDVAFTLFNGVDTIAVGAWDSAISIPIPQNGDKFTLSGFYDGANSSAKVRDTSVIEVLGTQDIERLQSIYIGGQEHHSRFVDMNIYAVVVIDSNQKQNALLDEYLANKSGVTL